MIQFKGSNPLHKHVLDFNVFLIRMIRISFFVRAFVRYSIWIINSHSVLETHISNRTHQIIICKSRSEPFVLKRIWDFCWFWAGCFIMIRIEKEPSFDFFLNLRLSLGTVCPKNLVGHKMHFMTKISCAQTVENIMRSCACFSTALHCSSSSAYIVWALSQMKPNNDFRWI